MQNIYQEKKIISIMIITEDAVELTASNSF